MLRIVVKENDLGGYFNWAILQSDDLGNFRVLQIQRRGSFTTIEEAKADAMVQVESRIRSKKREQEIKDGEVHFDIEFENLPSVAAPSLGDQLIEAIREVVEELVSDR